MWNSLLNGLTALGATQAVLMVLVGTLLGTVVGAIPGLGGAVLLTLLLPFIYNMPVVPALALLLAAHTGIYFSGSITAILFNTPGAPESAATTFDGYPMTKKGQPARALGISATATTIGGWVGVILLAALIPFMNQLTKLFHPSEFLALAILAIVLIGQMRARSVTKGLISGAFGLMIAFVGYDPITGVQRFTGGILSLYNGFDITAVALGLFAFGEMFRLYALRSSRAGNATRIKLGGAQPGARIRDGVRDVASHKWLTLRSSVLGTVLGIIPGVGGVAANFISYGQASRGSKHPERFGTGTPEGIIAPEASSISKEAGNLLPTVALGVPGGVGMAVLMSGFTILGLVPGPSMIEKHQSTVWAMAFVIAFASLLASLMGLGMVPGLVRLANVPSRILVPFVLALGFLGVYAASSEISQTVAVFAFGVAGWAMVRYGYSVPAAMIGFLLGKVVENNLYLVRNLQGWASLERPLTALMVVIIILSLFSPLLRKYGIAGKLARLLGRSAAPAAGPAAANEAHAVAATDATQSAHLITADRTPPRVQEPAVDRTSGHGPGDGVAQPEQEPHAATPTLTKGARR
ncbi:tripartite tricarboxylate transporter permease [uncultured Jatrophihabitans sp.]|uniref:tripartite tricarboxylate transporter permease n=1 Tax=uncultured Jatrophihabitans sp. TaxID=1610747 RepID=UPI0035CBB208